MTRKQKILISVFAAILFVAVIGITYAFFTATVTNNATPVSVTTTQLANLTMTSMKSETGSTVYPGWVGWQGIDVQATGSGKAIYDLTLTISGDSAIKNDVQIEVCKIEDTTTALAASQIGFTAATATVDNNQYYMTGGVVTLPTGCTTVKSASTLTSLGSSVVISETGGKELDSGKRDRYYIKITYVNNPSAAQTQGQTFTITPSISTKAEKDEATYLSDYIISTYGTDNTLYYHTNTSANWQNGESSYSSLLAGDNSYRYAGASNSVNNYVCFGTTDTSTCTSTPNTYLYRIIGVFNGQVKLIKNNSIGTYYWDADYYSNSTFMSKNENIEENNVKTLNYENENKIKFLASGGGDNSWSTSDIMYSLNGTGSGFLSTIPASTWRTLIDTDHYWHVTGTDDFGSTAKTAYTNEIANTSTTWSGAIGLMYVSDYGYAASPNKWNLQLTVHSSGSSYDYRSAISNDWLFSSIREWVISRKSGTDTWVWEIQQTYGTISSLYNDANDNDTRPTFYLESTVELDTSVSGMDGSSTHPYILKVS